MNPYDLLSLHLWGFTPASWAIFGTAVFIVGFSKTGIPGITILAVPLAAMVLPPKISVGVLLPIYMCADVVSVFNYFRHARLAYCLPYLLFVGVGVLAAGLLVGWMTDANFGVLIGWTVLGLLTFSFVSERVSSRKAGKDSAELPPVPKPPLREAAFFGCLVGLFSALANAAGPVSSLYLVRGRLPKYEFLGTTAVCAFALNWIKIPLFVANRMITADTLKLCLASLPVIALGGLAGVLVARRIPQKSFKTLVLVLAFIASVKLIVG